MAVEKISKEKLEQEIQAGKPVKQIADEYNYELDSLYEKTRKLGYRRLSKLNFYPNNGANVSLHPDDVEEALDKNGIERESHEDNVFYTADVNDAGEIVLTLKEKGLKKNDL